MTKYTVNLTGELEEKAEEAVKLKKFKSVSQLIKYAFDRYISGKDSGTVLHGMVLHFSKYKFGRHGMAMTYPSSEDIEMDEATKRKIRKELGIDGTVDDTVNN